LLKVALNTIRQIKPYISEWSLEIVTLCKEFKSHGVVAIDLAGDDFEPGVEPKECLHKQAFKV